MKATAESRVNSLIYILYGRTIFTVMQAFNVIRSKKIMKNEQNVFYREPKA